MACGKWPWEIWDEPADAVMLALEIEGEQTHWSSIAAKRRENASGD